MASGVGKSENASGSNVEMTTDEATENQSSLNIEADAVSLEFTSGLTIQLNFPINAAALTKGGSIPALHLSSIASDNNKSILPYEQKDVRNKLLRNKFRRKIIDIMLKDSRRLLKAAEYNDEGKVNSLLCEGADANYADYRQRTALHIAAAKGYTSVVKALLRHGADPNSKDALGNTPLHLAACTSHIETVTCLLKAGTDINQVDNKGVSPYHLARARLNRLRPALESGSFSSLRPSLRDQISQIVEMLETYTIRSGNTEEADLLRAFSSKLTVSDPQEETSDDVQNLLDSLHNMCLKS